MISALTQRFSSFMYGVTLPWRSFQLVLQKRPLMLWSLLPIVITFILYFYVILGVQTAAEDAVRKLIENWGWDAQGFLAGVLIILSKITLWIAGAFTFTIGSSIVASPFNDFLAEKTESYAEPPLPPVANQSWKQAIHLIGVDLIKSIVATGVGIMAILLSLIPIVNIVAFTVTFLLITFQYISYPQTRRGIKLSEGTGFLWRHLFACVGFGGTVTLLYTIPFLGSFVLPIAVVGGTLLVARAPGNPALQLPPLR